MQKTENEVRDEEKARKKAEKGGVWEEIKFSLFLAGKNPLVIAGSVISAGSILLAALSGVIFKPGIWKIENNPIRLCWNNSVINWHIQSISVCPGTHVYLLGTDSFGRDLLKMIILSLPTDLGISFAIVTSAFAIGIVVGSLAAYAGKLIDEAILRITDVFFAMPALVLAIVLLTVLGRSLFWLTIAVLIVWWPIYVRLVRSQILSEKEKPYAEALRSIGAGRLRILFLHILPNAIYPVLVQFTLDIGGVILTFSALMFLGFSPNPLLPELGNLTSAGISYVGTAPWLVIFPGLTILIIALGFNLLGDGIRDVLDPRIRR
jgi:peptide/nickel transport system permease protein